MTLEAGVRVGPYEIVSPLGAGGMGEVYRAHDTRLARDVAVKILPELFAEDPERLARFQREAQVLASLNHPHIAQIYGFEEAGGLRALAMELVDGGTLGERLGQTTAPDGSITTGTGSIGLDETLRIAGQIAEALEAAHDKGVIHRDLKPANVMLTAGGAVKVLDFGLAAVALAAESGPAGLTNSPTFTMGATRAGMILGTAAYMSPEQAAGKPVDKRADIWSFGVIVWEMLTGRRLFNGETISHTLADVLRAPIDFDALPAETPPALRDVIQRCLDRHSGNRLRDIGEARIAIQKYRANPNSNPPAATPVTAPGSPRNTRASTVAWALAALGLAAASALAFVHFREQPPRTDRVSFQVLPPDQTTFATTGVVSPDGRRLVFHSTGPDGRASLWLRSLDSLETRPLAGTEGAQPGPFWSPDNRFVAFGVNGYPGRLKKIDVTSGLPQTLCEYSGGYREGAWSADGVILFGAGPNGLLRVSETGGTPTLVTRVDASRQEIQHAGPWFLPDGRHFVYHRASRSPEQRGIYLGSLDAKPEDQNVARLLVSDSDPVYVRAADATNGFLLFLREGSLLAQSFDGRSSLRGDAMPIAEDVGNTGSYGWFSASDSGVLAYRRGRAVALSADLIWVDRQGKRLGQLGTRVDYSNSGVHLSPDGKNVVLTRPQAVTSSAVGSTQGTRVWTADLTRGIFSRLNPAEGTEIAPVFTPDNRVVFSSTINGALGDLYWMAATGVGSAEPLLVKSPTVKHPNHVSPDGRFVLFDDHTTQRQDLLVLPLDAPPSGERKPIPFVVTQADETSGQFSPDGKWVAYSSDESGRREVYVQGFAPDHVPAAAVGKWTISTAGGDKPRWRHDGKELYYLALDGKMMAVPVNIGATFEPGLAVPLFDTKVTGFFPYDVAADGRFLLNQTAADSETRAASPVTIVLNWQAGLKR